MFYESSGGLVTTGKVLEVLVVIKGHLKGSIGHLRCSTILQVI